jgi:hypothetical protein
MILLSHYPTVAVAVCGATALLLLRVSPRVSENQWAQFGFLALALVLFGIPLSGMWSGGPYGYNVIAGIFPYSDAAAYEQGSRALMEDGQLDPWNTRRPLTSVLLGSLFTAGSGSLQFTQAILVYLNAVAAFCAARALWASHGFAAGLLMLASLFAFYAPHLGSLLSENLGLALGSTAFALLWYGVRVGEKWAIAIGLFALSLGLNARAGAFFVLPALILWLSWRDAKSDKRAGLQTLVWTSAAALLGFVPGVIITAVFGAEQGIPFGNFAPSMYGLVVGGKGWTQVYADFPHVSALSESESFREIYRLAWAAAQESPLRVVAGVGSYYNDYFFDTKWHRFFGNRVLRGLALLLTLIGIAHCVRRRREPGSAFLLVVTAGVLASVPFVYDGAPRAYAATISVTAALIGIGATSVGAWRGVLMAPADPVHRPPVMAVAMTLVLVILCAPTAWLYAGTAATVRVIESPPVCPAEKVAAVVDTRPGSFVVVTPDENGGRVRLPQVGRHGIAEDFATKFSIEVPTRAYVARVRDRITSKFALIVLANTDDFPLLPSRLNLCGKWSHREIFVGHVAGR